MVVPEAQAAARRVLDTLNAYQRSAALACALELDLFTRVEDGVDGATALAAACHVSERGMRSLCDFLVAEGFLAKADGAYRLDAYTGPFLSRRSERSLAPVATFLHGETLRRAFAQLPDAVHRGATALSEQGTMETEHQTWVDFARGMAPIMAPQADVLAGMLADHGVTPGRVLAVAQENAAVMGLESRTELLEGDVRQVDLGGPHDLVLVTQFLHHFPPDVCVEILQRLRAAMAPGATLAVLEMLVDEDRITPEHIARFSLVLLATTNGGDSFTPDELRAMVDEAGFQDVTVEPLPDAESRVLFARAP